MYLKSQAASGEVALNEGENEGGDNEKLLLEDDRVSLLGRSTQYSRGRK